MELSLRFLTLLVTLTSTTLAQQDSQIAPHSAQSAPPGRPSPLGVRYSASTDVSHISFNSPLVTYGDSLNQIRLPAAPIQPATLRQSSQESNSGSEGQEEQQQTLAKSLGHEHQVEQQAQSRQPAPNQENQFISVQHYPARPQLQSTPQGFSLNQNLPGPQPQQQQTVARYAPQYPVQNPQLQYATPQPQQYPTAQPQQYPITQPQHYPTPQPQQYPAAQPQQYPIAQPQQYPIAQPQQYYVPQQQTQYVPNTEASFAPQQAAQPQYPSPVTYSSPPSNTYFATGPFAAQGNLFARQLPALAPQYTQPQAVAPQYVQPQYSQAGAQQYAQPTQYAQNVPTQYAQTVAPQYAQPVAAVGPRNVPVAYSAGTPAQLVSRVAFNGPLASFSYGF